MPSLFKMTDAKEAFSGDSVIFSQVTAVAPKPRNIKKVVIIAVFAVLAVAIILTAILVGMHLFTRAQMDILKYTMNVDKDTKQEVTSDPNENVNKYYVQKTDYDVWTVDDFNRDIRVTKVHTEISTNCYVIPLNRTEAVEPSKIEIPSNTEVTENRTRKEIHYDVPSIPILDTSFLGETAKDMCKGISVYWMYPKCSDGPTNPTAVQRQKRATYKKCTCSSCYLRGCDCCVCYYQCYTCLASK